MPFALKIFDIRPYFPLLFLRIFRPMFRSISCLLKSFKRWKRFSHLAIFGASFIDIQFHIMNGYRTFKQKRMIFADKSCLKKDNLLRADAAGLSKHEYRKPYGITCP